MHAFAHAVTHILHAFGIRHRSRVAEIIIIGSIRATTKRSEREKKSKHKRSAWPATHKKEAKKKWNTKWDWTLIKVSELKSKTFKDIGRSKWTPSGKFVYVVRGAHGVDGMARLSAKFGIKMQIRLFLCWKPIENRMQLDMGCRATLT